LFSSLYYYNLYINFKNEILNHNLRVAKAMTELSYGTLCQKILEKEKRYQRSKGKSPPIAIKAYNL
jgi:hypothetical protein